MRFITNIPGFPLNDFTENTIGCCVKCHKKMTSEDYERIIICKKCSLEIERWGVDKLRITY